MRNHLVERPLGVGSGCRRREGGGIEAIESLWLDVVGAGDAADFQRQLGQHGPVARIGQYIDDAVVSQRRAEQQRAVDQLAPQEAPDIVGKDSLGIEFVQQTVDCFDSLCRLAIEFPDHDRAAPAVVHHARRQVIGTEIDEAADHPLDADDGRDDLFVEAVLRRNDVTVGGEMIDKRMARRLGMVGLDAKIDALVNALQLLREIGPCLDGILKDRPFDRQAPVVDGGHMVCGIVDEDDLIAGADESSAQGSPDGAGAPDDNRRAHAQPPSRSSRVSFTATSQIACISSSGRS